MGIMACFISAKKNRRFQENVEISRAPEHTGRDVMNDDLKMKTTNRPDHKPRARNNPYETKPARYEPDRVSSKE